MSQDATSRLGRLLALVPWLSAHPGVSIAEAAEHFGITTAQLQDDLWLLVLSGLPGHGPGDLIDIQFWDTGDPASNDADTDDVAAVLADSHIFVVDPQTLTHAVRLTPQESVGLLLGLRQLATVPGDHDPGVLHDTIAALEQLMAADGLGEAHVVVESDTSPDILAAINAMVPPSCVVIWPALAIAAALSPSNRYVEPDLDKPSVEVTRLPTLTCAPAPNITPLGLIKTTRPLAVILPWIAEVCMPVTRLSAVDVAEGCLKVTVFWAPMEKLFQSISKSKEFCVIDMSVPLCAIDPVPLMI